MDHTSLNLEAENRCIPLVHCKTEQILDKDEIISILEQNQDNSDSIAAVLIGSRAARHFLPNFRSIKEDNNADWDMICTSKYLLAWLQNRKDLLKTINMTTVTSSKDEPLDLYVYCTLNDGAKYDFSIPRSSSTYTAYILANLNEWTNKNNCSYSIFYSQSHHPYRIASPKLLLLLKKYMLYYSHQWQKSAKDYYELLAIAKPLTEQDTILCDLFIAYNEKIHGKRLLSTNEFVVNPPNNQERIIIKQDEFFQREDHERIPFIYRIAMILSIANDILTGLEHICTQAPLWLVNYVLDNWIAILQEKYKTKVKLFSPCIQYEIDNYRLFPGIPEIATQRILHYITDSADFYAMQFVSKRWYTILRDETFWQDLYRSRYGGRSEQLNNISSWKMLYLIRLQEHSTNSTEDLRQLVDATISLRQYTSNDILKLWEDFTYCNQSIEAAVAARINIILANSFYYQMEKTSETYTVRLVVIGLEHSCSRTIVRLQLRVGEYGSSRFSVYTEALKIGYATKDIKTGSLDFFGPNIFGFGIGHWGYIHQENILLSRDPSTICDQYPSGLLICLFITMVHPDHRGQFIKYLKSLKKCSFSSLSSMGY